MNANRIKELRKALDDENISYGELAEIQDAFDKIDPTTLRDLPENALAGDMLDELESRVMKTYEIAITITDGTSVNAESEEEALELARTVFEETGYMIGNAELDIIGIYDDDSEDAE